MDHLVLVAVLLTWVGMMTLVIWRTLHLFARLLAFAYIEWRGRGSDRATGLRIEPGPLRLEADAARAVVRLFDHFGFPFCALLAADALALADDLERQRAVLLLHAAHQRRLSTPPGGDE